MSNFLEQFAQDYHLTINHIGDTEDDEIVGSKGSIFIHGGPTLAVYVKDGWPRSRTALVEVGGVVSQNADHEGVIVFDPRNKRQAQKAIHAAGLDIKAEPADYPENTLAAKQPQAPLPLRPLRQD